MTGLDAATFLQGQLSSDVAGLAPDACQHTSYNSPGGRMLANFVLWRAGAGPADGFRALLPEDIAEAVRKRLAMFVLRSKVTLADLSPGFARIGVGGPAATDAVRAALGAAPATFGVERVGETEILGLPGPRYVVVAPGDGAAAVAAALAPHATPAGYDAWQWLTIRAGVPVVTAPVQDRFVAADRQLGRAGRRRLSQGLLHRPGDRRPDAVSRPAEGAAVRLPRAGIRDRPRRAPVQHGLSRSGLRHRGQRRARARGRLRPPRRAAAGGGGERRRAPRRARTARR